MEKEQIGQLDICSLFKKISTLVTFLDIFFIQGSNNCHDITGELGAIIHVEKEQIEKIE